MKKHKFVVKNKKPSSGVTISNPKTMVNGGDSRVVINQKGK